jgi:hypothetical protein
MDQGTERSEYGRHATCVKELLNKVLAGRPDVYDHGSSLG